MPLNIQGCGNKNQEETWMKSNLQNRKLGVSIRFPVNISCRIKNQLLISYATDLVSPLDMNCSRRIVSLFTVLFSLQPREINNLTWQTTHHLLAIISSIIQLEPSFMKPGRTIKILLIHQLTKTFVFHTLKFNFHKLKMFSSCVFSALSYKSQIT